MAKIHGKNFAVYVEGAKIADSTDCSLNVNMNLVDVTSKDDANWSDKLAGMRDWSIDVSYLHDESNTPDGVDLIDYILNATQVTVEFSQAAASTVYWYGEAFVSSASIAAPLDGGVTGSINFVGTGALSKATISGS